MLHSANIKKVMGLSAWVVPRLVILVGLAVMSGAGQSAETGSQALPGWPEPVYDSEIFNYMQLDQLEYRSSDEPDLVRWDALMWLGGDYNRLWVETEGQMASDGEEGELERFDLEYGRLIAPFWDLQGGIRYQRNWSVGADRDRVLGLHGLAPYKFEIEADLLVSEDADVQVQLQATYDVLLTQRLIFQPRLETAVAASDAKDFGIGEGINSFRLGARLRYEIRREFAPYIGLSWSRKFGRTADFARAEDEVVKNLEFVAGIRIWF